MKNKTYLLIIVATLLLQACQKDSKQNPDASKTTIPGLGNGLISFSIGNQVMTSNIDTSVNYIHSVVADSADYSHMIINFTLAPNVVATVNGAAINSGATVNMSKLFYFKISTLDGRRSSTFLVDPQRELAYWGVPGTLISGKSLTRNYNYYFDQFAGTTSDNINCALATTTMAIKWADSTFTKNVVDARSMYLPAGEWSERNMSDYMTYYGISHEIDSARDDNNIDSLIKTNIDNNRIMIFLVYMHYITSGTVSYQHLNSFWYEPLLIEGHCFVVKGYRQTSQGFYAEAYDPFSHHQVYVPSPIPGEPVGQDRYYISADVKKATALFGGDVFVVAAKGQTVAHPIIVFKHNFRNLGPIR